MISSSKLLECSNLLTTTTATLDTCIGECDWLDDSLQRLSVELGKLNAELKAFIDQVQLENALANAEDDEPDDSDLDDDWDWDNDDEVDLLDDSDLD